MDGNAEISSPTERSKDRTCATSPDFLIREINMIGRRLLECPVSSLILPESHFDETTMERSTADDPELKRHIVEELASKSQRKSYSSMRKPRRLHGEIPIAILSNLQALPNL